MTILFIDDDHIFTYAMSRLLRLQGLDVTVCQSYDDALRHLEGSEPIDLLVTDVMMPTLNGFALARMARMRRASLPVIYLTGAIEVPENEALGEVLRKPVDEEQLGAAIRRALNAKPTPT